MNKLLYIFLATLILLNISCDNQKSQNKPDEIPSNSQTEITKNPESGRIDAEGQMKVDLDTDFQKMSYAVGQQMGAFYLRDSAELDVESFIAGFHDGFKKVPNQIPNSEIRKFYSEFSELQRENTSKRFDAAIKKNERDREEMPKLSKKVLAENKSKPGVKVSKTGLQYTVVEMGNKKMLPKEGHVAKVNTVIWNADSSEVTSTFATGQPVFGNYYLLNEGFMEGINLVGEGGKIDLLVPSEIGFGPAGMLLTATDPTAPRVPGNSAVFARIEVLEYLTIEEAKAQGANVPTEEELIRNSQESELPEGAPLVK